MSRMSSSCKFLLKRKIYQTKVPFFTGRALLLLVQKVFCAIFWEKPSIGTESPLCFLGGGSTYRSRREMVGKVIFQLSG